MIYPYVLSEQKQRLPANPPDAKHVKERVRKAIEYAVEKKELEVTSSRPNAFDQAKFELWAKDKWPGTDGRPGPGERAFAQRKHAIVRASVPKRRVYSQSRTRYLPFSPEGMKAARTLIAELEQRIRDLEAERLCIERARDGLASRLETDQRERSARQAKLVAELKKWGVPPRAIERLLHGESERKRS